MQTTTEVRALFKDSGWNEQTYVQADGVKLAKAYFERTYRGDLEGRSVTELLMVYRTDDSVSFVGLERFEGKVLGRAGSFVIQSEGDYRAGVAESRGHIVTGAGTGELRMLTGEAPYRATHDAEQPVVLRVAFTG